MAQYIDKDAIVAKIDELVSNLRYTIDDEALQIDILCEVSKFINTLEVKEVDSKVKEEIKIGETEIYLNDDGGEAPYDGKQWLDLSCMEYEIPEYKFKDGDKVELIIRKK